MSRLCVFWCQFKFCVNWKLFSMIFASSFIMPCQNSWKLMQFQNNWFQLILGLLLWQRAQKIDHWKGSKRVLDFSFSNHIFSNKTLKKSQSLIPSHHSFANQHWNLLRGENDRKSCQIWMKFWELIEYSMLYHQFLSWLDKIKYGFQEIVFILWSLTHKKSVVFFILL